MLLEVEAQITWVLEKNANSLTGFQLVVGGVIPYSSMLNWKPPVAKASLTWPDPNYKVLSLIKVE